MAVVEDAPRTLRPRKDGSVAKLAKPAEEKESSVEPATPPARKRKQS